MNSSPSPNEVFTKLVWDNLWNNNSPYYLPNIIRNGIDKDGINIPPLALLSIDNVPSSGSIQLMESHDLASWLPVKTGYIGIEFSNVGITGLDSVADGGFIYTDNPSDPEKGSFTATISIPGLNVSGDYSVVATGLAECALDTAGALSFLPVAGNSNEQGSSEQDAWLEAARSQRRKLWQTPNGAGLMDQFYDHNEVYNWIFQNDAHMQGVWTSATNKFFLQQTYQASQDPANTIVNNGVYAEEDSTTTYNGNAFAQQIALALTALGYAQNPPVDGPTSDQFNDAAKAALFFASKVNTTGNNSTQTTPMTVDQVYQQINDQPGEFIVPDDITDQFLAQLTPEQKAYLDKVTAGAAKRVADDNPSATLIQGSFQLNIGSGNLAITTDIQFPGTGTPTLSNPSFSATFTAVVDINNKTAWTSGNLSSLGVYIEEAYEKASFINNMLSDKLNDELNSSTVKDYITNWINNTLAQVLGPLMGA